jgi:uncharacterized protein
MYKQYLKIALSNTGQGVFTSVEIPANVPIMEFGGDVFTSQTAPNTPDILQIGNDMFLGASGAADDYLNHSCNPNCSVHVLGKRAILYSLYVIQDGSELTFDYSTTSTDTMATWQMDCNCGSINCRKVISGARYLSAQQTADYTSKGMLPPFMTNPIFK